MKSRYKTFLPVLIVVSTVLAADAETTYGEWEVFATGKYEYSAKAKETFGFSDQEVSISRRLADDDPAVAQIKVDGLFKTSSAPQGSELVFNVVYDARGNGTLSVPETTLDIARDNAPVMYTDLYSWLKRHYPDEPTIDLYDEVSSFYINDNVFEISAVYYHPFDDGSQSGHYYVQGEFDKLYIGEAPDYDMTLSGGHFSNNDGELAYEFDASIGSYSEVRFALAEGELGIVDFARVATAVKNDKTSYVSVRQNGHVSVPAPTADATSYTLVGVLYDRLGNFCDEYKEYLSYNEAWEKIGTGTYSDGFMRDFFDIEQSTFDVDVEKSRSNPVRVRIVNPYKTLKPNILQGDNTAYDYTRNYYLTFEVISPGRILMYPSDTGILYGTFGEELLPISVTSRAWQAREAGLSDDEIAEKDWWGKISDLTMTFPKSNIPAAFGALFVGWNGQYYYANDNSNFRITCSAFRDLCEVSEMHQRGTHVFSRAGGIEVTDVSRTVISDMQGRVVYTGTNGFVALSPGIYVVVADTTHTKIVVK